MSKKISELTDVGALDGTEQFETVQSGLNKKITLNDLLPVQLQISKTIDLFGNDLIITNTVDGKTNQIEFQGNGNNIHLGVTVADGFNNITCSFIDVDLVSRDTTNHHGGELIIDAFDSTLGATYIDYDTVPTGIKYDADYSATFVDRSLVDKAYVDAAIAAALP